MIAPLLAELFLDGSITVVTPEPPRGEANAKIESRLVIYGHGAVVLQVTPAVLADEAKRKEHARRVARRLAPLNRFRTTLRGLHFGSLGTVGAGLAWTLYDFIRDLWQSGQVHWQPLLKLGGGLAFGLVLRGVAWLVVYFAKRRVMKMLSDAGLQSSLVKIAGEAAPPPATR